LIRARNDFKTQVEFAGVTALSFSTIKKLATYDPPGKPAQDFCRDLSDWTSFI